MIRSTNAGRPNTTQQATRRAVLSVNREARVLLSTSAQQVVRITPYRASRLLNHWSGQSSTIDVVLLERSSTIEIQAVGCIGKLSLGVSRGRRVRTVSDHEMFSDNSTDIGSPDEKSLRRLVLLRKCKDEE